VYLPTIVKESSDVTSLHPSIYVRAQTASQQNFPMDLVKIIGTCQYQKKQFQECSPVWTVSCFNL